MAQGLQVFNANGDEVFNSSTRTLKVIKRIPFDFGNNGLTGKTISISHDLFSTLEPVVIVQPTIFGGAGVVYSVTGNTLTLTMRGVGQVGFANLNGNFSGHEVTIGVY